MEEEGISFEASAGKISSKLDVFYNPDKKIDRDINSELIRIFQKKYGIKTGLDLLAASGVRGLRLAKNGMKMTLNDLNPKAYKQIIENSKKNKIKAEILNQEANQLLNTYHGKFDYTDIDPFGPPIQFLEAAIKKTRPKNGIIAVTATDSSALCGTYINACKRKYNSTPLKTDYCHELGLRILIKECVRIGAKHELSLTPIFSYSRRDYFRTYLLINQGAGRADSTLKKIGHFQDSKEKRGEYRIGEKAYGRVIGPIWLGELWDKSVLKEISDENKIVRTIKEEAEVGEIGYYHLPNIFSIAKKSAKTDIMLEKLRKQGFKASKTHFDSQAIRTNAEIKDIIKTIKSI